MAFLVRKTLISHTSIFLVLFQCHTIVGACLITIIGSGVIHGLHQRVTRGIEFGSFECTCGRVILVLLSFAVDDSA